MTFREVVLEVVCLCSEPDSNPPPPLSLSAHTVTTPSSRDRSCYELSA